LAFFELSASLGGWQTISLTVDEVIQHILLKLEHEGYLR
jgi:hypothetical protein